MDAGLLDTLVKLASLGASGVCIFAIFWIGWLILRLPAKVNLEKHKTLRMFMIVVVLIALISGVSGLVNAKFNADEIAALRQENQAIRANFETYKNQEEEVIREHREREIKTEEAAKSLGKVLESKEAYNLRYPSEEIQMHIDLLKRFLAEMGVNVTVEE
jgi:hypothetical protein